MENGDFDPCRSETPEIAKIGHLLITLRGEATRMQNFIGISQGMSAPHK